MAEEFKFKVGVVDGISPEMTKLMEVMSKASASLADIGSVLKGFSSDLLKENSAALKASESVQKLAKAHEEVAATIPKLEGAEGHLTGVGSIFHRLNAGVSSTFAPMMEANEHVEKLGKTLGKVSEVSGFSKISEMATAMAGPLMALSGIASLGGVVESVKSTSEWGKGLQLASISTGIDVGDLSVLQFQAQKVGVGTDEVTAAVGRFNKVMADAASGKNREAAALFAQLQINTRENGHLRTGIGAWLQFTDSLKDNKNAAIDAQAASIILGRSYKDMLPVLKQGAKGFEEAGEEARKTGNYLDSAGAQAATRAAEAWERLGESSQGLSRQLGLTLSPAMTKVTGGLADFVQNNPKTTEAIVGLAGALTTLTVGVWGLGAASAVLLPALPALAAVAATAAGIWAAYKGVKSFEELAQTGTQPNPFTGTTIGLKYMAKAGILAHPLTPKSWDLPFSGWHFPDVPALLGIGVKPNDSLSSPTTSELGSPAALTAPLAKPVPKVSYLLGVAQAKQDAQAKADAIKASISVDFTNVPRGVRVKAQSQNADVTANVGHNWDEK